MNLSRTTPLKAIPVAFCPHAMQGKQDNQLSQSTSTGSQLGRPQGPLARGLRGCVTACLAVATSDLSLAMASGMTPSIKIPSNPQGITGWGASI